MPTQPNPNLEYLTRLAASGTAQDVDTLMQLLVADSDLASGKLIDYALSLVESVPGSERIKFYLFHGQPVQRNFAALYFKRRGMERPLAQAYALGLIDYQQGFAR